MPIIATFSIIFLLSVGLTGTFRRYALKKDLLDHPNHRSSHTQPTPRGGGIVFVLLFLLSLVAFACFGWLPILTAKILALSSMIVALVGYWDDVKGLPAKLRFAMQLAAAVIFLYWFKHDVVWQGWLADLGRVGLVLMLLGIVWSTNLYNFMDGTDGIASLEALFIFGVGGGLLWLQGGYQLATLAWALVAGVGGFLVWNWPKAKIFMGDVASSFLGFLIIPFALLGYFEFGLSVFVWFILYTAFTFDATLTLLRRLLRREAFYQAHKLHAYQRLHQSGMSHRQVLFVMILLNSFFALLAFFAARHTVMLGYCVITAIATYLAFYAWVERRQPMYAAMVEAP